MILWIHQSRPRPQWYELGTEEHQRLLQAWGEIRSNTAAVDSVTFVGEYSIRGQSTHERAEVWTFTDIEELDNHWHRLEVANYRDWHETENLVGSEPIAFQPE